MKKTKPNSKGPNGPKGPKGLGPTQLTGQDLQAALGNPPALFMPPADHAHDIYALSAYMQGFEHQMYQDIQQDHAMYDSLQRWPYLFGVVLGNRSE